MARTRVLDLLQSNSFWITTITPSPSYGFNPLLGFSACSLPEISIDNEEIIDGNAQFKRKASGKMSVGNMTLSRGASFYDTNFLEWAMNCGTGNKYPRRDLVLLHLTKAGKIDIPVPPVFGPYDIGLIPARFWILSGCIPVRYKPGNDFEATSNEISIVELEIAIERMEEYSITDLIKLGASLL